VAEEAHLAERESSRRRLFEARDLAMGGLFGALAIVVPIAFHVVGMGKVFLPMYLPVLALGLLASWEVSLIVGCTVPLISFALTGMPPLAPPVAILMVFELGAMATVASLVRSAGWGLWPATILGITASRAVGLVAVLTVLRLMGFERGVSEYVVAGFVASLPGVVLLLTVVPGAVFAIERTSILGRPEKEAIARDG